MIGTSWSAYAPMRVKCIHRCFFASSCSSLSVPLAGGVAVSRFVAMRHSPFAGRLSDLDKANDATAQSQPLGRRIPAAPSCTTCPSDRSGFWGFCVLHGDPQPRRLAEPAKRLVGRGTFGRTDPYG